MPDNFTSSPYYNPDTRTWDTSAVRQWEAGLSPDLSQMDRYMAGLTHFGGLAGRMKAYPEVYNPSYSWTRDVANVPESLQSAYAGVYGLRTGGPTRLEGQLSDWNYLKDQFTGTEATFIRWLIDKKVDSLRYQLKRQRESMISLVKSKARKAVGEIREEIPYWGEREFRERYPKASEILDQEWMHRPGTKTGKPEEAAMPIPDWMKPIIESGTHYAEVPEIRGAEAQELRPLSAQEELTPEQMSLMAGYEAWGRAGAPTDLSLGQVQRTDILQKMADWQPWWEAYTRLSKKLFPKQTKLRGRWATATQR